MAPELEKSQDGLVSSVEVPKGPIPAAPREETNVRVVARFRPPITDEEEKDQPAFAVHAGDNSDAIDWGVAEHATVQSHDGKWSFEFDTAFSEEASQEVIYHRIGLPAVQDVLTGYNGTLLMYGQTGSGKTFSLFGRLTHPELRGLAPRAAEDLVQQCLSSDTEESSIQCSFLEIYRERMRDLLHPSNQSLRIKEIPHHGLMVDGLTQDNINSSGDILKTLDTGNAWRSVAATRQNQYSSRSHAIFTLYVSRRSLTDSRERTAKLSLVDLAGSERVSRSHCVGETLEEAKKINASLTALGKVIDALVERRTHVPYRDSTLTRVLEEALGGNSRTTLLVTASACSQYLDETVCSLRFAARAQKVRNSAHVNFVYSTEELWPLVAQLQKDLAQARRELSGYNSKLLIPRRGIASKERRSSSIVSDTMESKEDLILNPKAPDSSWSTGMSRNSTLSVESPRSESSPSVPSDLRMEDEESASPVRCPPAPCLKQKSEVVLQAALDAVQSLQQVLLAQEEVLEKAKVLRPEALLAQGSEGSLPSPTEASVAQKDMDADAKDKIHFLPNSSSESDSNMCAERWRLLRSTAESHALRWRLQRERCRSASLQEEVDLRILHSTDLQRQLEAAHAELALLKGGASAVAVAATASPTPSSPSPRRRTSTLMKSKSMAKMQSTPSLQLEASPRHGDQLRALREAQCALRGENLELKQELAQKEQQMAALSADLASARLNVRAKSHEANVKDALLSCLQKEAYQVSEQSDEELQKLIAAVATPLLAAVALKTPAPCHPPLGNPPAVPMGVPLPARSSGRSTPAIPSHFSSICVLPGMPAPMAVPR